MSNISQPVPTLSMYSILNGEEYGQFCTFQIVGKTIFQKLMHTFHIFIFEILKRGRKSQSKTTIKNQNQNNKSLPYLYKKKIPMPKIYHKQYCLSV